MRRLWIVILLLSTVNSGLAQDPIVGLWRTVDDETGRSKAIVRIFEQNSMIFGRILEIFPQDGDEEDPICDKCTGDAKGKKVIGMDIVREMERDGDQWINGTITDPENGRTYDCKLWLEDGILKVRGYVAFFYRTQQWIRVES